MRTWTGVSKQWTWGAIMLRVMIHPRLEMTVVTHQFCQPCRRPRRTTSRNSSGQHTMIHSLLSTRNFFYKRKRKITATTIRRHWNYAFGLLESALPIARALTSQCCLCRIPPSADYIGLQRRLSRLTWRLKPASRSYKPSFFWQIWRHLWDTTVLGGCILVSVAHSCIGILRVNSANEG